MEPLALPGCDNSLYTRCYCEENIYWLVKQFLGPSDGVQRWDVFAVFISNPTRSVALWNQRMGASRDTAIVWDYHVVLALRVRPRVHSQSSSCYPTNERKGVWIYDLDTCLPVPCHWKTYIDQTFPLGVDAPAQYRSLFRAIPGDVYLDNFASDRSHMLASNASEEPRYHSEPPPYAAICGPEAKKQGVVHNLVTHFVSMADAGFGTRMDFKGFVTWCSCD